MKRYGFVIQVKEDKLEEYKKLHRAVWEDVKKKIKEVHIDNYSIYYRDGYLFSYYEYCGEDYERDMEKMAMDSRTKEWWKLTDLCQIPVASAKPDEHWAAMEEVFHLD